MIKLISGGSDPEFFLRDQAGNIVSSQTARIKGSKRKPKPLIVGAMHKDNVLLELNVPPSFSEDEWVRNHLDTLRFAESEISDNYKITDIASFYMDPSELWSPEAQVFGCEPDYSAWDGGSKNPPPEQDGDLRSAGGHMHFGVNVSSTEDILRCVKACDLALGVPSILMDPDTRRRALYGKAGAFRAKPYGFEYRTCSNFWMSSEELMRWAWRGMKRAVEFSNSIGDWDELKYIRDIIDNGDVQGASDVCEAYGLEVVNG